MAKRRADQRVPAEAGADRVSASMTAATEEACSEGLGLKLVRQIAEHGLGGEFRLGARPDGGTRAEVAFSMESS